MKTIVCIIKKKAAALHRAWRCLQVFVERGTPTSPVTQEQTECCHCGHVFRGNYCPRCGQSSSVRRGKPRFLKTFRDAYPQLSGNFLRTMVHLALRPGYMVRDYFLGHRVPYRSPVNTFLLAVSIVALCTSICRPFVGSGNANVGTSMSQLADSVVTQVAQAAGPKGKAHDAFAQWEEVRHNTHAGRAVTVCRMLLGKMCSDVSFSLFLAFPVLGVISYLVFRKRQFYGRRLSVMEHYVIFVYLDSLNCFIDWTVYLPFFYVIWMYRGVYRLSWWRATGYSLIVFFFSALAIFLLFFGFVALLLMPVLYYYFT